MMEVATVEAVVESTQRWIQLSWQIWL